jgi:hypothetical protein
VENAAAVVRPNAAIHAGGVALGLVRWAGVAALVAVVLAAVLLGAGKHG